MSRSAVASAGIIGAALVAALAPMRSPWVERLFSGGLYPVIQPPLTRISNLVPFALFDVVLVVVSSVTLAGLILACARPRLYGWRFLRGIVTTAALLYLLFLVVWGLHYRREPLRRTLEFRLERVTQAALTRLAAQTIAELNDIHPQLPSPWPEWSELRSQLGPAFEQARMKIGPRWRVELGEPKRSLLNIYFHRTAVDGMIDPFFLEVLVNRDLLPFERAFIVSHEWGHLAGRANESEASFLGWVTCMHGPLWARYSAWLSLYGAILSGLPRDDQRAMAAKLAAGPRRDLVALRERIARQSTARARRLSEAAYDRFLKANRLPEGVASYGLVVTLLLGAPVDIPPLESTGERSEKFKVQSREVSQ